MSAWALDLAICMAILAAAAIDAHGISEAPTTEFDPPSPAKGRPAIEFLTGRVHAPGRAVLQSGALPLPPAEACGVTVLAAPLLVTPGCQESVTAGQATDVCCSALEAAVGPESNATTRNCLCAESVWVQIAAATDQLGIPIRKVLDGCK